MDENLSTSPTEDGVLVTIDNFDSVESTPVVRPQTPLETPKQVHINTSSQLIDAPIQQLDVYFDSDSLGDYKQERRKTKTKINSTMEELSAQQQMKTEEDEILLTNDTPDLFLDTDILDDPFADNFDQVQNQDSADRE